MQNRPNNRDFESSSRPRHSEALGEGLFGRNEVEELMAAEFDRCQRHEVPLTCFLVELERLDQLGAIHGHNSCEEMRARVAELLEQGSRAGDLLGYPEGNLLWMLLPHTSRQAAEGMARRVRSEVNGWDFSNGEVNVRVNVRVGIASNEEAGMESLHDLQSAAFYALQDDGVPASPFRMAQPNPAAAPGRASMPLRELPETNRRARRPVRTHVPEPAAVGPRGAVLLSIFEANLALQAETRQRRAS
ncbi:MAG TPA: diguanylate cyclase [Planctomycetes bacterium]|nr:diguanylate cyclase [Planctomycetota bacterium]HIK61918.1 diguanylate cyclase [Planctomycetota bacterium]